jgi:signal transduction histidine kinase
MFVNLVDNAVKYGRPGADPRQPRGRPRGGRDRRRRARPRPEDLERVFQPFFRADPSRNVDDGGIGLGLPIARSTARAHGGDVDAARRPAASCAGYLRCLTPVRRAAMLVCGTGIDTYSARCHPTRRRGGRTNEDCAPGLPPEADHPGAAGGLAYANRCT